MTDASQGYHQIMLAIEDHKNVSFITSSMTFCYVAMSFELTNAGATYQQPDNKIFRPQLGGNVEVYVDGIIVKSKITFNRVADLEETFEVLKELSVTTLLLFSSHDHTGVALNYQLRLHRPVPTVCYFTGRLEVE
ncbi:hypothetical protein Sango_0384800 [Sesamum angolense]|uniref:Uncharacterized protein n=1 Tax=Sesamum angolense TaxID=2727404 RepID=A0AAE1XA51_9LAMI|nr:hypothetical protein Sango_0384800 [Sesamum angolense]